MTGIRSRGEAIDSSMPESTDNQHPPLHADVPVVLLASACWDVATPVNVHHIARRFAAVGNPVLFVESTGLRAPSARSLHDRSRIAHRIKGWWRGARQIEQNLTVLSPLSLPANWPQPARKFSTRWLSAAVRHAINQFNLHHPVLWAFLPGYHRVAELLPHRLLIYHCVDDYAANPGVDAAAVREEEKRMLDRADLVLASSAPLAERLQQMRNDVHLRPNVAFVGRFTAAIEGNVPEPDDLKAVAKPRAVYAGNLAAYRFDSEMLAQVAERLPSVQFVLIGPFGVGDLDAADAHWQRLIAQSNVHAIGPRPHESLPAYLAHCDAGIIPFLDNDHTRSSFPLKVWEMLGAGLPIVTTDLPALRGVAPPQMIRMSCGAEAFAEELRQAIAQSNQDQLQRITIARQHDWAKRIDELRTLIGSRLHSAHSL
jgi:glycosyltransferase involved in cell wall biosynthesis